MATTSERHLESLPVSPEILGRAAWWYDVSWYGLIVAASVAAIGAFATVTFTLLQFWSGGVLDRHTEWRTSTLELETAQAKLDLTQSQERIAELGKTTAEANKVAAQAQLELERIKTPRTLTREQQIRIAKALQALPPVPYDFNLSPDPETIALMEQIDSALKAGGWTSVAWVGDAGIEFKREKGPPAGVTFVEGIHIEIVERKRSEWGGPVLALAQALKGEGLDVELHATSNREVKDSAVHIVIGRKK